MGREEKSSTRKVSLKVRVVRGGGKSVGSTFFSFSFDLYHKGTLGKPKQGKMLELLAHTHTHTHPIGSSHKLSHLAMVVP